VKIEKKIPPRKFAVGLKDLEISHVADVYLEHDQMVTFVTNDGAEYDVVRKNWDIMQSLNSEVFLNGNYAYYIAYPDSLIRFDYKNKILEQVPYT
jgi:hypothetical protein